MGLNFLSLSCSSTDFWFWRIRWSWPSSKTPPPNISPCPRASGRPCPRCRSPTTTRRTASCCRRTAHTTSPRVLWEENTKLCWSLIRRPSHPAVSTFGGNVDIQTQNACVGTRGTFWKTQDKCDEVTKCFKVPIHSWDTVYRTKKT